MARELFQLRWVQERDQTANFQNCTTIDHAILAAGIRISQGANRVSVVTLDEDGSTDCVLAFNREGIQPQRGIVKPVSMNEFGGGLDVYTLAR